MVFSRWRHVSILARGNGSQVFTAFPELRDPGLCDSHGARRRSKDIKSWRFNRNRFIGSLQVQVGRRAAVLLVLQLAKSAVANGSKGKERLDLAEASCPMKSRSFRRQV